ncbi:hypothetical protein [Roseobacter phage RDJL6]|nr:hypothetical protein [Roseobacter phage RDJL6]
MRPKLLWSAAEALYRLTNGKMRTRALDTILQEEEELNDVRRSGHGDYSPRRHVEVLGEYLTAKRKAEAKCT